MISEDNAQVLNRDTNYIAVATLKVATVFVVLNLYSCNSPSSEHIHSGEAQGTTYMIKYTGDESVTQLQVDSVIESMDVEMNTWRNDARISKLNNFTREDVAFSFDDQRATYHFCFELRSEK